MTLEPRKIESDTVSTIFPSISHEVMGPDARIKIARRNINNLRYANDTTLMVESEEKLKSLLMKEESEKAGFKLSIQKAKIIASDPNTSWQIDEETMETVTDFIFLSSKLLRAGTAAMKLKDICSLEEKL